MKKILLSMSVLASMLIAGCSQDEAAPEEKNEAGGKTYFMSVNLMSSDATGARAGEVYEDGTAAENKVFRVRFYFFNGAGGAVNVKRQGENYVNYYDWTPGETDQTDDANPLDDISSKLKATLVINTEEGDKIPQRIAALVNPRAALLNNNSLSLPQLKEVVANYADAGLTTAGTFVMFNSVFKSGNISISSSPITEANLCEKPEDAILNPVTLYVERCVAKVRVTLDQRIGFDSNNRLKLTDKEGNFLEVEGQQVYLKLEGWGLSAETSSGRLVKKIDPLWEGAWVNSAHRSCWAINDMAATNMYNNYSSISTPFGSNNALYTNENAQAVDIDATDGQAQHKTKVIIKGTLCKEDGSPLTITSHLGVYFVDDESQSKLKESFLTQLAVNGKRYYYETETGREQIGIGDLQVLAAEQTNAENSQNNCYTYPQLTSDAARKIWYTSLDKDAQPIADVNAEINGSLKDPEIIHKALVWNSGMTYYFYEIKHLAEEEQEQEGSVRPSGVVRNHVYATNVTKIAGLGTPVYDPEKTIYPEIPNPSNHYIAAEINVLSWHLVNNDYELVW